MDSIKNWIRSHPNLTAWIVLAIGMVAILVWVFYSAMVVLYGAKFTQVYAAMYGTPIKPVQGFTFKSD